jgi:hypothetical protein
MKETKELVKKLLDEVKCLREKSDWMERDLRFLKRRHRNLNDCKFVEAQLLIRNILSVRREAASLLDFGQRFVDTLTSIVESTSSIRDCLENSYKGLSKTFNTLENGVLDE